MSLFSGWLPDEARSTTNPGKSSDSVPSPYHSQEPTDGRPGSSDPVLMNVWARSWTKLSVFIDRTMHNSSATVARWGNSVVIAWPERPHRLNGNIGATHCFVLRPFGEISWPFRTDGGIG